jgi:hypothetical protein
VLFKLVNGAKEPNVSNRDAFQSEDQKTVLAQPNRFELSFETFTLLHELLVAAEALPQQKEKIAVTLILVKVLEKHLSSPRPCSRRAKRMSSSSTRSSSSNSGSASRSSMSAHPLLTFHVTVFHRLKVDCIFLLLSMTRKIKRLESTQYILDTIFGGDILFERAEIDNYLTELLKLKDKSLADYPSLISESHRELQKAQRQANED